MTEALSRKIEAAAPAPSRRFPNIFLFSLAYLAFTVAGNLLLIWRGGCGERTLARAAQLDALFWFGAVAIAGAAVRRARRRRVVALRNRDRGILGHEAANQAYIRQLTHELRTPLNAVLGFSELIRDQSLGGAEALPRYAEYAGHIHDSGARLLALANDMIEHAKAGAFVRPDGDVG